MEALEILEKINELKDIVDNGAVLYTIQTEASGEFLCKIPAPNTLIGQVSVYKRECLAREIGGEELLQKMFSHKLFATKEEAEKYAEDVNTKREKEIEEAREAGMLAEYASFSKEYFLWKLNNDFEKFLRMDKEELFENAENVISSLRSSITSLGHTFNSFARVTGISHETIDELFHKTPDDPAEFTQLVKTVAHAVSTLRKTEK